MKKSAINFTKLHDKLSAKPRAYYCSSVQLISSVLSDAVECMDSLPLNGGVCDAYDMSNLLHDINEMDMAASIARFQTNADTPFVTFGYLWMNWRGCPAFVEEISGGVGVPDANVSRLLGFVEIVTVAIAVTIC